MLAQSRFAFSKGVLSCNAMLLARLKKKTKRRKAVATPMPRATPTTTITTAIAPTRHGTSTSEAPLKYDRESIQRKEKELLRFFGAAPIHKYLASSVCVPLTWQLCTSKDSAALSRAMLFPSSANASQSSQPAGCEVAMPLAAAVGIELGHSPPPIITSAYTSNASLFHQLRTLSRRGYRGTADLLDYRLLGNRYSNSLDSRKDFGGGEYSYDAIRRDVQELWRAASAAHKDLRRTVEEEVAMPRASGTSLTAVPKRMRVVFLVFYSHTRGEMPVAESMREIGRRAVSALRGSSRISSPVLRVVPIAVGIHPPALCGAAGACTNMNDDGWLAYPNGGLYTFNAVIQAIAGLPFSSCKGLQHKTILLSESWLLPRTIAAMHNKGLQESVEGKDTRGRTDERSRHSCEMEFTRFVPEMNGQIEVVPGVVSGTLSALELKAFARYTACRAVA